MGLALAAIQTLGEICREPGLGMWPLHMEPEEAVGADSKDYQFLVPK